MLGYDYPLMGVFWTMLWFMLWIIWLMLLFRVFADLFRNHQMGGGAKTLWIIFVIIVPFFGVFVYLLAHGRDMGQRDMEQAQAQDAAFKEYVKDVTSSGGTADQLAQLADLKDRGVITQAEFDQQKVKILG